MEGTYEKNVGNDFFYQNDVAVTKTAIKLTRWLILVFPGIMLFSVIGLFQSKITDLIILMAIGVVVTMGPTIAYSLHASLNTLKYATTFSLACLIALMSSNASIGIYMTYAFAMVFSLLYYDKKLTFRVAIVSYFLLVIGLYFRSLGVKQSEFDSNFIWFISRSVGFLMEAIVMAFICVRIAAASHKILEKLNDTQKVADLVEKCSTASMDLNIVVHKLETCIDDFRSTNSVISNSAESTLTDCNSSLEYVGTMQGSLSDMDTTVKVIEDKISQMLHIADEITEKLKKYISFMEQTAEGMQKIEQSSNMTDQSIRSLEEGIKEVSEFAETISRITQQTNLLALNASIEAARAGEAGRGFSVVADEVRDLADNSKKSSDAIAGIIKKIVSLLNEVQESNKQNRVYVQEGIGQINSAKKEAGKIGELQITSREMAGKVSESSASAEQYSRKVLKMAEELHTLVQNTMDHANQIVQETQTQTIVTGEVASSFSQVSKVSHDLVSINNK